MFSRFSRLALVAVAVLSSSAFAGELVLKNGDRLQGDLTRLEGDNLIWASDSFGELTVAKSQVDDMNTSSLFKVTGSDTASASLASY